MDGGAMWNLSDTFEMMASSSLFTENHRAIFGKIVRNLRSGAGDAGLEKKVSRLFAMCNNHADQKWDEGGILACITVQEVVICWSDIWTALYPVDRDESDRLLRSYLFFLTTLYPADGTPYRFTRAPPRNEEMLKNMPEWRQAIDDSLTERYECQIGHIFNHVKKQLRKSGSPLKDCALDLIESAMPNVCENAQEPARYELTVSVTYPITTPVGKECLPGYTNLLARSFDRLDTTLTQRCSSSVQVFVRFLDVKFCSFQWNVTANYTIQILPSVLQDVFYELYGLTLRTIFDLRIPGVVSVVQPLVTLAGETIATQAVACPSLYASATSISQVFGCATGEVLRQGSQTRTLPECLPCPKGTFSLNNTCLPCPPGTYQNEVGQVLCKTCPDGTYKLYEGVQKVEECLRTCGNGMFSSTGMIPCQPCPRNTYSGPPKIGGYRKCDACPYGTFTPGVGATGPSLCKVPCQPGQYSWTGLQPCSPCPPNFYQPSAGQLRCIECPNDTFTDHSGANSTDSCRPEIFEQDLPKFKNKLRSKEENNVASSTLGNVFVDDR